VNTGNIAVRVNGVNMVWQVAQVTARDRYHHGDLRTALLDAAVAAARAGGEQALGLNRLAAQVGVSPSAAYRHFPEGFEQLLVEVGDVGRRELAERIERAMAEVTPARETAGETAGEAAGEAGRAPDRPPAGDPATVARLRFRASGQAYVDYVLEQPGLFQVASRHDRGRTSDADPFALLEGCIDALVATGQLPADRQPDAAAAAWATVHGLATLLTEGPLRRLPDARRRRVVARTLDMVQAGL